MGFSDDLVTRREALITAIRTVAAEIGFQGPGDFTRLARELDQRGIEPLMANHPSWNGNWGGRWYGVNSVTPGVKIRLFLKRHIPDLYRPGAVTIAAQNCLCPECPMSQAGRCEKFRAGTPFEREPTVSNAELDKPVRHEPVSNGPVRQRVTAETRNIHGWTVRQDKKGFFRAYRRINGNLKSVYLGKSLDGAEEKLRAANERWGL